MGIIIKQSIKGTIWSYVGVIIGFVTTSYLYTEYLTPDIVGLLGLLVSYSQLFGRFSLLGLPGVTGRLFPYFRNREKKHNGFLFVAFLFQLLGLAIFLAAYFILKPTLIASNIEKSSLFVQYLYLLVPLTIANMLFLSLDAFNRLLYDAVFGTFLQEFFQRILIFLTTILYAFKLITLEQFIIIFAIAISIKALIILFLLMKRKEISLKPNLAFLDLQLRREILSVALFSLAGGLGSMLVFNLDKIIVNQMLDLANTGVYTIAFYFGSLINKPSQPLLRISGTLVAESWRTNDLEKIREVYYKSCLNQLIIGGFLFLGIWANIDNILIILGNDYLQAKWVIFFVGLGYLIDMSTGVNGQIIVLSKHYRMNLVFLSILVVIAIGLMYLLIPIWGIVGAAIAIAISLLLNNLMRFLFLYQKFGLQPFSWKYLIVILFFLFVYLLLMFIPHQKIMIDLLIRSSTICILSALFFDLIPISEDAQKILKYIKNFIRKT